ncbi:thiol:disulfide interchange protein DsbA [Pseudoalteromonas ulvae UL12]|uniref:thioredoxin domain-containing protein n=1 Tax=Pseudoalteromonas ulvae TaxID=107327 RepID=UPI00186B6CFA|nr:thioredoxin domain-containing protein [Pseudoalteromonas ulvae]MBE0362958.1 thiol:disulfide interchange protein DsbA [Pseudoalteromonas ulvae UL12]
MKKILLASAVSLLFGLTACSKVETPTNPAAKAESVQSQSQAQYQEGVHYRIVSGIDAEGAKVPFIVEYFWLGCPHCQHFEAPLQAYKAQQPELGFVRKHAILNESWANDGRIFYALQQTNNMDHFADLFDLYKQGMTQQRFDDFFTRNDIDKEAFLTIAGQDATVIAKMQQSLKEMTDNKIHSVPAIVVNGKYLVVPHDDLRSNEAYFALVDYLQTLAP